MWKFYQTSFCGILRPDSVRPRGGTYIIGHEDIHVPVPRSSRRATAVDLLEAGAHSVRTASPITAGVKSRVIFIHLAAKEAERICYPPAQKGGRVKFTGSG